jgi:hypothetical protein
MLNEHPPYVGPRPFRTEDEQVFFGRERETSELLSLITAHATLLVYAQSGAGKSSLLNAGLVPLLKKEGFETLGPTRVQGLSLEDIEQAEIKNIFVYNSIANWAEEGLNPQQLARLTLAEYLKERPRVENEEGEPSPRVLILDQFEELFTMYLDRRKDRLDFFQQISDALEGSPLLFRTNDLIKPAAFLSQLRLAANPLAALLHSHSSGAIQRLLDEPNAALPSTEELQQMIVDDLNQIIQSDKFYQEASAKHGLQSSVDGALNETKLRGQELIRQNRSLLEAAFPNEIARSVSGDPLLRVVFVMREDYIAELDPYASVLPEQLRTRYRLERLREGAALQAIKEPLRHTNTGRTFTDEAARKLVSDLLKVRVKTEAGLKEVADEFIEPVQLQVVCKSLWEQIPATVREITPAHLRDFGDVNQSLAAFYEECLAGTMNKTKVKEGALRRWFDTKLITPAGTRGTIYHGEGETGGLPDLAVQELRNRHIIRPERRSNATWYELAHDRFIEPIKKSNEQWLLKRAAAERIRQKLEAKAADWVRLGRGNTGLLDESGLHEAEEWLVSPEADELSYSETLLAFVDTSRTSLKETVRQRELAHAQEEAEAQRRRADEQERLAQVQYKLAEAERRRAEEKERLAQSEQKRAEAERLHAEEQKLLVLAERKRARLLRVGLVAISLLLLLAATLGGVAYNQSVRAAEASNAVRQQADLAQRNADEAQRQAKQATENAKVAQEQQALAQEQQALAEANADEAERQKRKAIEQAEIADTQRRLAEKASEEAKKQTGIAQSALITAKYALFRANWQAAVIKQERERARQAELSAKIQAGFARREKQRADELAVELKKSLEETTQLRDLAKAEANKEKETVKKQDRRVPHLLLSLRRNLEVDQHVEFLNDEQVILAGKNGVESFRLKEDKSGASVKWDLQAESSVDVNQQTDELRKQLNERVALNFLPDFDRQDRFITVNGQFELELSGRDMALLRDKTTGKEVRLRGFQRDQKDDYGVTTGTISPDHKMLVLAGEDGITRVWDLEGKKKTVLRPRSGILIYSPKKFPYVSIQYQSRCPLKPLRSVAFSSNSQYVVTGGEDSVVRVYEAKSGKLVTTLAGHTEAIKNVGFSRNMRDTDETPKYVITTTDSAIRVYEFDPDISNKSTRCER